MTARTPPPAKILDPGSDLLERIRPSGGMPDDALAAINGAAKGDINAQRSIRDSFAYVTDDEEHTPHHRAIAGAASLLFARLAASHGDLDDVILLGDALIHAAAANERAQLNHLVSTYIVEAIGLYERIAETGHEKAAIQVQALVEAMPPQIVEEVKAEQRRIAEREFG